LNIEPAVPTPLRWSEVPITFSCADQWTSFSEPGRFPLILKPVVAGSKLNKVLIDSGSGLNVLFTKTLKKMKLDITHMLTRSTSPFYSIVPGNAAIPLGSVLLPVTFGKTRENYRTEYIKFEVADFETSYHAILGRPAIAKFMVVPHYTYLVLKMPSPAGVLSLQGELKISFDCDTEAVELAATNQVPNAMIEIYAASKKLAPSELDIPEKSDTANKPRPSEEVQVKAAFITPFGAYFYTTMFFRLKNASATYQRAIQKCFKKQLNKNVEAHMDDVVVKTRNSNMLIADLEETFAALREYQWKLNPNKCVFGVPLGKLLGFIISHRGIEANPEKISAIIKMKAPTCIKDVQKLTGCMAALNRFISKLGEWGLPFFKLLKHQKKFVWTPEVDQALAQLKDFLSKPPVLTAPCKRSSYCSTSLQLLTWSVPPSLSSGKKTATPTQSSDQSTSSARSCWNPRHATN
jgi:hypothetical protein